ncbi:MAG: glycosyltransferase family 39 protein [Bacteroidales bacterium]|jgi:4-amino-4-deoxy-L-arabinose transferase-like glycosyltransferase|nr:glycosyltransferase family 39 protein [Bacteroidales bacterium]
MSLLSLRKYQEHQLNIGFWLLTIAIFIGLIVPTLIREGMFMDGQQYACVAKNLANGKGSFWFPILSDTWWKAGSANFMEHPPLVYGLQSILFKLFDNSIYSERIYSFLTAIFHFLLITKIWKTIYKSKKYAWYPVLILLSMPVVSWSFQNNIMENTMSVFTLTAILFLLKSLTQKKYIYIFSAAAGLSVFFAFLSKGAPALFPFGAGIIYLLIFRQKNLKQFITSQIIFFLIPITIFFILLSFPVPAESLLFYLKERLLYRISNEPTVGNRLFIILNLIQQLAIPLLIVLLLLIFRKIHINQIEKRYVIFFTLIGLSASLPLLLTSVQRSFYLTPSLPFFAIALGILSKNAIMDLTQRIKQKRIITITGAILLCLSITLSVVSIGKYSRDKDMILDVKAMGEIISSNSTICISDDIYNEWNLQMYLIRYNDISVKPGCTDEPYLLVRKTPKQDIPVEFERTKLNLLNYELFKKSLHKKQSRY